MSRTPQLNKTVSCRCQHLESLLMARKAKERARVCRDAHELFGIDKVPYVQAAILGAGQYERVVM